MNTDNIKDVEEMLTVYGSRKAPYTFRFKGEEKAMTKKRKLRPAYVISCIACLLICAVIGVGILAGNMISNENTQNFMISVSAAEDEDVQVGTERIPVCREDDPVIHLSIGASSGDTVMSVDGLTFKISGEDIVSYDIKAEKGTLDRVDFEVYYEYKETGVKTGEYLFFGSSFEDLKPFDESDPYRFVVGWMPDLEQLNSDMRALTGGVDGDTKKPTEEQKHSMSQAYNSLLKSAEDFSKYFDDTITVTLHYSDGTTEVLNIEITLDENGYAYAEYEKVNEDVVVY